MRWARMWHCEGSNIIDSKLKWHLGWESDWSVETQSLTWQLCILQALAVIILNAWLIDVMYNWLINCLKVWLMACTEKITDVNISKESRVIVESVQFNLVKFKDWLFARLVAWLISWFVGWLTDWLIEGLSGGLPIIVLADLPNSDQRFEVLIGLIRVNVVEGAAVSRVAIWGGEINRHLQNNNT